MSFHSWATRGHEGYDLWNTYGDEEVADKTVSGLKDQGYSAYKKKREDLRHNIVWDVYYRMKI